MKTAASPIQGSRVNKRMATFRRALFTVALMAGAAAAHAAPATIGVFVALADNENQGIVPVPKAIGDGDDPEHNLYWATAEGLKGCFDTSAAWSLVERVDQPEDEDVLRRRTYRHVRTGATLYARAYRGIAIKRCITDFEDALRDGSYDLAVYIGHNGLMDFQLPIPEKPAARASTPEAIVLCCRSEAYFRSRLDTLGAQPILLTRQLMYPGAFILLGALDAWLAGAGRETIQTAAAQAYAKNQKISLKAARGIFADLGRSTDDGASSAKR